MILDRCCLIFRVNSASCEAITSHLSLCYDKFDPPLDSYINIEEYGVKIYNKAVTFEAWVGGTLVGLVAAYFNDTQMGLGYITNVSVIETYRTMGIASSLLEQAVNFGRENNFLKILLEVEPDNSAALTLYQKCGFSSDSENKSGYKISMVLEL